MLRLRQPLTAALVGALLISPFVVFGQADTAPAQNQAPAHDPTPVNRDAAPALWRFVYPNAKVLISIDCARIRQSQAVAMLREKWHTMQGTQAFPIIPEIPGMELVNSIDRVLISSPGNKSPDDSGQPPVLIAIHGQFEAGKVREIFKQFGAKPQSYDSFQVYRPQGKQTKEMALVLFDPETILAGDAPSVFAALDRNHHGAPPPAAGSMVARAAEMESNYDFWAIMEATEILANDSVAALFHGGTWASEARGFEAGINLRSGLVADVTVRFSSEAAAKQITTDLTRIINAAAKDKTSGAQVQEFAKKLKFAADGSNTKISLRLTQPEMEKMAQAFAAGRKATMEAAAKAKPNTGATFVITPAPVPSKPAVIRIEGLDDGPREIPLEQPR